MIRTEPIPGVYASLSDLVLLQHKARGFSFLPRQPIHSLLAGRHASRLRGRGLDFEELRHYQFGDDVRQIDWRATNRTRKTQLRVFSEERERVVLLVVDQRLSMFFGSGRCMKSVAAAEAAALAGWRVVIANDRVGAVVFNDSAIAEIRPQRSRTTLMQILDAVLEQNHALSIESGIVPQAAMLNEALRRVERLATHDVLVCLITDGRGADEETERLTTRVSRHNDVLALLIYDPLEVALPNAGPVVFAQGARQLEVDTGSARLRSDFQTSFEERVERARSFLLHREIPLIPISTAEDVADQLRRLLGSFRATMNPDPTSLDRLHDVIVSAPAPWWPPAPGWLVIATTLCLVMVWWLIGAIRHWQSNCYRREALALLENVDNSGAELATLMKRVAITAYPRERVASLTGERWLTFLDDTGRTNAFTKGPGRWLVRLAYEPQLIASLPDGERHGLVAAIRDWIVRHGAGETSP